MPEQPTSRPRIEGEREGEIFDRRRGPARRGGLRQAHLRRRGDRRPRQQGDALPAVAHQGRPRPRRRRPAILPAEPRTPTPAACAATCSPRRAPTGASTTTPPSVLGALIPASTVTRAVAASDERFLAPEARAPHTPSSSTPATAARSAPTPTSTPAGMILPASVDPRGAGLRTSRPPAERIADFVDSVVLPACAAHPRPRARLSHRATSTTTSPHDPTGTPMSSTTAWRSSTDLAHRPAPPTTPRRAPRPRPRRHRRRPADDRARRHHREHRAAPHPDRPRLQPAPACRGSSTPTRSPSAACCCSAAGSATCSAAAGCSSSASLLFALASLVGGLAQNEAMLLAARVAAGRRRRARLARPPSRSSPRPSRPARSATAPWASTRPCPAPAPPSASSSVAR